MAPHLVPEQLTSEVSTGTPKTLSPNQILVSDITSKSSPLHCPVKRKKKAEKIIFKNEWLM